MAVFDSVGETGTDDTRRHCHDGDTQQTYDTGNDTAYNSHRRSVGKLPRVADILGKSPEYGYCAVVVDIGLGVVLGEEEHKAENKGDDHKKLHGHDKLMALLADGVGEQIERFGISSDTQRTHHAGGTQCLESHHRQREEPLKVEWESRDNVDKTVE